MAQRLPTVDVLLVGFGWTGAIMAQELTQAGHQVLAIERGSWRDTSTDFAPTFIQDELRYRYRGHLFEQTAQETLTFRNTPDQTALPMRRLGSFLPGTGVGGSILHWNGQAFRFLPYDFEIRRQTAARYGQTMIPADMTLQDWGVTYDELEPYYTRWEELCGISGQRRQSKRPEASRRQSFRRPTLQALSNASDEADLRSCLVRRGSPVPEAASVPLPVRQHVPGLYEPAGRQHGALHLLRLLRKVRLRQLLQGERPDDNSAGAYGEQEFPPCEPNAR
ncbi:hypothetical protein ACVOMV_17140 [Mesorhizobium atlanticum]